MTITKQTEDPTHDLGVFILGMHRSGTSAATRVVNMLGVPLCTPDDLMHHLGGNPTGHWESASLMPINEHLLHLMHRTWIAPPPLEATPLFDQSLLNQAPEARRVFRSVHTTSQWAWKDPRLALLLPYWLAILPVEPTALLILRDPREVAASLNARDGIPHRQGIAAWERYTRHALRNCEGLPCVVTAYPDLLADPVRWSGTVGAFLRERGLTGIDSPSTVTNFIDPNLRHHVGLGVSGDEADLTISQRDLWATAWKLRGVHAALPPSDLPPESQHIEEEFTESLARFGFANPPAMTR